MNSHWIRFCLVALLSLCVSCSSKNKEESPASTDERDSGARIEADPENLSEHVDKLVAEAAKLPRAEFDPAALARKLGHDPQAHFEWVRDHTWWAPYRGLLRGSQGVMLDRLGSNLDRAVLLGDLLRRSGHAVRLAHAELSESRARELLGQLRPMPQRRGVPIESHDVPAEAAALIQSQTNALLAAVRDAASPAAAGEATAIAALQDHWWVERKVDGKWIAMDVLLPGAKTGDALKAVTSHSDWNAEDAAPSIPDSLWHSVELRVVIERYEAGATTEATVLKSVIRPAEMLGRPLRLSHIPVPWPEEISDPDANPQLFRDAALAVRMWAPVLQVGNELLTQSAYTVEGELKSELVETVKDLSKVGGAEVVSGMDMALGGFGAEEATPAVTAEWVDYEIHVPGAPSVQLRRPIFDLLGPARRASNSTDFDGTADLRKLERFEALWSPMDILAQPCDFTVEFIAHLKSADFVANQEALRVLAREQDPVKARDMTIELLGHIEVWGALPDVVLWRSVLAGQTSDTFIDRPNLLQYRIGRVVVNADQPTIRELVDVASNPSGVRPGVNKDAFEVRLRQGVADTVAEMVAVGADVGMAENTASVFGRLAAEKSRGLLITARDEAAVRALPWPEDEIARVASDVNAGYMVVVPRQAVMLDGQQRVGWWRVDPTSGDTVGVMDNGYHATMAEQKVIWVVVTLAPFFARPGNIERADRARRIIAQGGGQMLTHGQRRLLAMYDAYRALMGDLEVLARG